MPEADRGSDFPFPLFALLLFEEIAMPRIMLSDKC